MKDTEIRRRVHAAIGDSPYPAELTSRVTSRLAEPPRPHAGPRLLSLVAALLAFAIVATLVFIRFQSTPRILAPEGTPPTARPAATPHTPPAPAEIGMSQGDLDRTQLSTARNLVTPLNLSSTNNGRTVTLIGAYADSARTVLFFRSMPIAGYVSAMIYDDTGFLNAGSTAGRGSIGDFYYILDTGPHPDANGMAHLRVTADVGDKPPAKLTGAWTFTFEVRVGAFTRLNLQPVLTTVGTWRFTIEAMDLTSTLIHFQAVIDGAAVEDIQQNTISVTDVSGHRLEPVTEEAGTTVPKSQLGSTPPRSTRVNLDWNRPAAATTYTLSITGGGARYSGVFVVPALDGSNPKAGGPGPTIYPISAESLQIDGAFSNTISTGRPTACGSGSGGSGVVYEFALLFLIDQDYYWMNFQTDPSVREYTGPGTYTVEGQLFPDGASAIFQGPVQLTITSDKFPGPRTGSVHGTMHWTGQDSNAATINVSGNWQCTWSDQLGPG